MSKDRCNEDTYVFGDIARTVKYGGSLAGLQPNIFARTWLYMK